LDAEKRAIVLKDMGISQSEKGRIILEYEDANKAGQEKIAQMEQALSDREEELKKSERKLMEVEEELEMLQNSPLQKGFVPVSVPMEYEVEIITHTPSGEVDSDAIAKALARRGPEGWKLHSLVNDEGGRLQASLGASEKYSLSSGSTNKEDRVVLIFERVMKVMEESK